MGLAFTYGMTYGGALIALFNPYVGFLIYVCFGIIRPPDLWYWSVPQGNYSRILAVALILGWVMRGFGDWRLGRAWVYPAYLVAYLGWAALSATQALIPSEAWVWVESQAKIVIPVIIGLTLVDSVKKLKQLAWVVLLSHAYLAYDFNLAYFGGFNRLKEVGFGALDNNCMGIALVTCCGLGGFMVLSRGPLWQKGLITLSVGLMIHTILFSNSRGAMLGLIVLAGTSFIVMPKRPVYFFLLLLAIGATLSVTGDSVWARFNSSFGTERDSSAESRVVMWNLCLREAASRPVFGLGPHHFPVYARSFGLTRGKEAHTTWLQLAAEIGIPGVGFLLAFYCTALVQLWRFTRESARGVEAWSRDIARMVVAAVAGFLFTAQFVTLPGLEAPFYVTLLGAGTLKLITRRDPVFPEKDKGWDEPSKPA
jgi:O-antigen ligase